MTSSTLPVGSDQAVPRRQLVPNKVFGMLIFVITEAMFFTALVSAFMVIRGEGWSLPSSVRLPVAATGYNTAVLLISGITMFLVGRYARQPGGFERAKTLLGGTMVLGTFFLVFQGFEWWTLMSYGLSMKSSIFGACFFLVIGSHALHVLAGVASLCYLYVTSGSAIDVESCAAVQIFWTFVVGIWPLLYALVYF